MRLTRILTVLLVVAGLGLVSSGADASPVRGHGSHARTGLVVDGAVRHRLRLTDRDLARFGQRTVTATYSAGGTPTTSTFTGPLLLDVLTSAGPRVDPAQKNDVLAFAVRATATDGYRAVVAWGEIDPGFAGTQVLVARTENGRPLARPRLVVPGDAKGGRYVTDVRELRLLDLGGR